MSYDYLIKLVLIGDSACGKSSLMMRFVDDTFNPTFITTIGIDFKIKVISLQNKKVKIQIWDTAGQERFRSITNSYYRGASGIILVYDITNRQSFKNIEHWIASIDRYAEGKMPKILVGCKLDLDTARQVSLEEGKKLAGEYSMHFYEVSSRNGVGVNEVFEEFAQELIKTERTFTKKAKLFPCQPSLNENEEPRKCCS